MLARRMRMPRPRSKRFWRGDMITLDFVRYSCCGLFAILCRASSSVTYGATFSSLEKATVGQLFGKRRCIFGIVAFGGSEPPPYVWMG